MHELTTLSIPDGSQAMVIDGVHRLAALDRLAALQPDDEAWEAELSAVTLGFVDAILEANADALADASDPLRDYLASLFAKEDHAAEIRGWILALLALTRWALQRLPSSEELALTQETHASRFLHALEQGPRGSSDLRQCLNTGHSQVSRVGRGLLAAGLVVQRRLGREAMWEVTPRGRLLLRKIAEVAERQPARDANGHSDEPRRGARNGRTGRTTHKPVARESRFYRRAKQGTAKDGRTTHSRAKGNRTDEVRPKDARAGEVRHVLPAEEGGWKVVKNPSGRAITRAATKNEAVARAKEIVGRAGGGVVETYDKSGKRTRPTRVPASGRAS
jgi:DNA-binding MarR family transcriptional regulator